jgi:hypothetical protein
MNLGFLRLRAIGPPLAVAAACAAGLFWFDRIWIPAQQQYLNERNLRSLRTIAAQIKAKVDNFDQAIDHAIDSFPFEAGRDELLQKYVKLFSPELEIVATDSRNPAWTKVKQGDPPNVTIQRDEGRNYLYLGYLHEKAHGEHPRTVALVARGDIDRVTETLLSRNDFDALLLVDGNGATIAQQSSSGLELTNVDKVRDRGPTATPTQPGVFARLRGTTGLAVVTIGAADFILYTQPVTLSLVHDDKGDQVKEGKDAREGNRPQQVSEEWTLCGLVRLDRLRAASSTIPTTYWLWIGAALALICFVIPVLKPRVLSARERLTRLDSVSMGAAIFMMMALATLTALDLRAFGWLVPSAIDQQLEAVASSMVQHVRLETGTIAGQMDTFVKSPEVWRALGYDQTETLDKIRGQLKPYTFTNISLDPDAARRSALCDPSWACRSGVLEAFRTNKTPYVKLDYPFFKMVVWSDNVGWQRIKWSTSAVVTPFVNVEESKLAYSDSLKLARRLSLSGANAPQMGVSLIASPNTGEKLTVFWKALKPLEEAVTRPSASDLTGVTMATSPISLTSPVLPKNLQFAVVDRAGRVLFHSDPTRTLAENIFQESENNPTLRSLVANRDSGAFTGRYLGRAHRFYVAPLDLPRFESTRWSLLVFQPAAVGETANLGTLILAASMFVPYALALAGVWAVLGLFWPNAVRRLLWPAPARGPQYRRAAAVGTVAGLVCMGALAPGMPTGLLVGTIALVVCALAAMFVIVKASPAPLRVSPTWSADFIWARASLLLLLSAVPVAVCFHLSYAFHSELVAKRAESQLRTDLRARARRVNQQAQRVAICSQSDPGSQACPAIGDFVGLSLRDTLWDVDIPIAEKASSEQTDAAVPAVLRPFLKLAYWPYNDVAADLLLTPSSGQADELERLRLTVAPGGAERLTTETAGTGWRFSPAIAPRPPLNAVPLAIAIALTGVAWVLVRYLLRPIFGLELGPAATLLGASGPSEETSLLVVGPPGTRRTARLLRHPRVRIFDVRTLSLGDDPTKVTLPEERMSSAADSDHAEQAAAEWPAQFELAVSNPLTIVAISHLEHRLHDPAFRGPMLECLESALYRHNATLWCSSARDPIEMIDDFQPTVVERRGWAHVFARFRREHVSLEIDRDRSDALAATLKQHAAGLDPELQSLIVSECEVAPELLAIGENLARRLPPKARPAREEVLAEIEAGARHFYETVWNACATDERVVLRQLAEEGLVNPNNRAAISRLLNSGLVRRGQMFHVVNESFRRFVLGAAPHATISTWEHEGVRVPWGTIATTGVTAAFGLAGLLLLTQEQLVDAWMSYIPALAPAIPTVWKVLAGVQKGRIEIAA